MIGYKILSHDLKSIMSQFDPDNPRIITYKLEGCNETPDLYRPLMVFVTIETAKKFLRQFVFKKNPRFFRCRIITSSIYGHNNVGPVTRQMYLTKHIDNNPSYLHDSYHLDFVNSLYPQGTLFADQLKFLEEMEYNPFS